MFSNKSLSPYENCPSSIFKIGGESTSGSENSNTHSGSSIIYSIISILFNALILDCTKEALLALNLNLSINF